MNCDADSAVPDWIIEHPETARVFDELRIDASCGGKSLQTICHQKGLSSRDVLDRLREAITENEP